MSYAKFGNRGYRNRVKLSDIFLPNITPWGHSPEDEKYYLDAQWGSHGGRLSQLETRSGITVKDPKTQKNTPGERLKIRRNQQLTQITDIILGFIDPNHTYMIQLDEEIYTNQLRILANANYDLFLQRLWNIYFADENPTTSEDRQALHAAMMEPCVHYTGTLPKSKHPVKLELGPVKGLNRMRQKARMKRHFGTEYPTTSCLFDVLRASVICESPAALLEAYNMFNDSHSFTVVSVKNKIRTWKKGDVVNLHVNAWFTLMDGSRMIIEVLFYLGMHARLKTKSHKLYEVIRGREASVISSKWP